MKAVVFLWDNGNWIVAVSDCDDPTCETLLDAVEFTNEFAAQTYADAINMGVIHYEAETR